MPKGVLSVDNLKRRAGLDIGIGSIGWAVAAYGTEEKPFLEDFGVRIFDSGEQNDGKDRDSQERRGFRSIRRVLRRRHFRKERIKAHLENIGLISANDIDEFCSREIKNIFEIKCRALSSRITPQELAACLIHACNHRGYRSFYENAESVPVDEQEADETSKDKDEEKVNEAAAQGFDKLYKASGCKSVSEFICQKFTDAKTRQISFRNRPSRGEHLLIRREHIADEVHQILESQKNYYPQLNPNAIDMIEKIIFSQRAFEDGPGNASEKFRRYAGFLDSLGFCPFYADLRRGYRSTVIGDIFAVTNTLSQYRYTCEKDGEYYLPPNAAQKVIKYVLLNGAAKLSDIKNLLKNEGISMFVPPDADSKALNHAIRFIGSAKKAIDAAGLLWTDFIDEEQFDEKHYSKLHQIAVVLSENITPARRKQKLAALPFATDALVRSLSSVKAGGTSGASDKYMCEAIHAFMDGEIYGNFQANRIKQIEKEESESGAALQDKLPPSVLDDEDLKDNPVVFRAVNETRKVINAIIDKYGSLEYINIEVASELNRSYLERKKMQKRQKENEAERERIRTKIIELAGLEADNDTNIDKYKLYEEQGGKCLYSGKPLGDIKAVLSDKTGMYEIDHIVPESLILDNTLQNKALVFGSENQRKRQRTPLMYLSGPAAEEFKARVNLMFTRKSNPISRKKYSYLMLDDLYSEKALEMLSDWKSRNINDTRYITKYIVALLKKHLKFSGGHSQPVYGIKGAITSKFRRRWLNKDTWGDEEKDRSSYLNHAADAVIIVNLTPAYVEIATDSITLNRIFRSSSMTITNEYNEFLAGCVKKMKKYYGFPEDYTRKLLSQKGRIPSFIPNIGAEVDIRFNDSDQELFDKQVKEYYGNLDKFTLPPRMPMTSHKQEKRFRDAIADSNPVKIREVDGKTCKIRRQQVSSLTAADMSKLYTKDKDLVETLTQIFKDRDAKYTVADYMKEHNLTKFTTNCGQPVYKVSLNDGAYSTYYKKEIDNGNYSMLGVPAYYAIEVYKDKQGRTKTFGLRYVDIVKRNKKLFIKHDVLPEDYAVHICYLQANDYIVITDHNNNTKFSGLYLSVKTIGRSQFYGRCCNKAEKTIFSIATKDTVDKYSVDILGRKGGKIRCSAPLSLIQENTSKSKTTGLWSWPKTKNGGSR